MDASTKMLLIGKLKRIQIQSPASQSVTCTEWLRWERSAMGANKTCDSGMVQGRSKAPVRSVFKDSAFLDLLKDSGIFILACQARSDDDGTDDGGHRTSRHPLRWLCSRSDRKA